MLNRPARNVSRSLSRFSRLIAAMAMALTGIAGPASVQVQAQTLAQARVDDSYRPPAASTYPAPANSSSGQAGYGSPGYYGGGQPRYDVPPPPPPVPAYGQGERYGGNQAPTYPPAYPDGDRGPAPSQGYGQPYSPPSREADAPPPRYSDGRPTRGYYEQGEIVEKGRGFFGSISQGLASAIEHTYRKAGRPNGYILGEDGGGALFVGLRYGQGMLYTKDAGDHRVFWRGPSLGYDMGGEGSKTMVLVYNLSDPSEIYQRFGGVEGSAYVVGGVSVQFQKSEGVTLAVIRSGVGLRLGANVGYTKYSRTDGINPF
jgi:hypothetical protein